MHNMLNFVYNCQMTAHASDDGYEKNSHVVVRYIV
jgi:hypothetical protein